MQATNWKTDGSLEPDGGRPEPGCPMTRHRVDRFNTTRMCARDWTLVIALQSRQAPAFVHKPCAPRLRPSIGARSIWLPGCDLAYDGQTSCSSLAVPHQLLPGYNGSERGERRLRAEWSARTAQGGNEREWRLGGGSAAWRGACRLAASRRDVEVVPSEGTAGLRGSPQPA